MLRSAPRSTRRTGAPGVQAAPSLRRASRNAHRTARTGWSPRRDWSAGSRRKWEISPCELGRVPRLSARVLRRIPDTSSTLRTEPLRTLSVATSWSLTFVSFGRFARTARGVADPALDWGSGKGSWGGGLDAPTFMRRGYLRRVTLRSEITSHQCVSCSGGGGASGSTCTLHLSTNSQSERVRRTFMKRSTRPTQSRKSPGFSSPIAVAADGPKRIETSIGSLPSSDP